MVKADEVTELPRDERHDSIDPATGTLTAEARDLRRAMEGPMEDSDVPEVPAPTDMPAQDVDTAQVSADFGHDDVSLDEVPPS